MDNDTSWQKWIAYWNGDLAIGAEILDASGSYAGGMPGATAAVGTSVAFAGTDILRIKDGRITDYWLNSDVHVMAAQLRLG